MKHENLWSVYLSQIGMEMAKQSNKCDKYAEGTVFLKCHVSVKAEDGSEVDLTLPESRQTIESCPQEHHVVLEHLDGFKGRMQNEYSKDPIGPYMGPLDQSEKLPLNIQLPQSQLDFRRYTEYRHEESTACHSYGIKDSYIDMDELEKIILIVYYSGQVS